MRGKTNISQIKRIAQNSKSKQKAKKFQKRNRKGTSTKGSSKKGTEEQVLWAVSP